MIRCANHIYLNFKRHLQYDPGAFNYSYHTILNDTSEMKAEVVLSKWKRKKRKRSIISEHYLVPYRALYSIIFYSNAHTQNK